MGFRIGQDGAGDGVNGGAGDGVGGGAGDGVGEGAGVGGPKDRGPEPIDRRPGQPENVV